ncbi:MAG TPA: DUF3090 family protein [Chloroflexota bacterium]|jgi:uncharacterized repeat protein (TIGR03847 family)
MATETVDLGPVRRLEACALGAPGRRTFRLVAANRNRTVWLWLEREELQVLGMTVEQLLGGQAMSHWPLDPALAAARAPSDKAIAPVDPGERPSLEFKVGRLAMGFEEQNDLFVLLAHDQDADADGPPTLRCEVSRRQLRTLSEQITAICAAGRPRCPLCGAAMDRPKHPCPRLN